MDGLQTGDLLLFRKRAWYRPFLSCRSEAVVTHVSMVLRDPVWMNESLLGLFYIDIHGTLWEQSTHGIGRVHIRPLHEAWTRHGSTDVYVRHAVCDRDYWFTQHIRTCCAVASMTTDDISAFLRYLFVSLGYLAAATTPTALSPAHFGCAKDLAWVDHTVSWSDEFLLVRPVPLFRLASNNSVRLDADATTPSLAEPQSLVKESVSVPFRSDKTFAPLHFRAVIVSQPPNSSLSPAVPPTLFPGITVVPVLIGAPFPSAVHRSTAYTSPLFPTCITGNQAAPRYEWTK